MPKINPRIKSIDDLLGLDAAEESPIEPTPSVSLPTKNTIITLPPQAIRAFRGHPFRLYEGDRLNDLVESISEHGVLNPAIIRKIERDEDGFEYEMLAGHNRQNAAAIANRELPCIVKENLSDEDAWIYVIETNVLQRSFSEMLPSEKAAVLALRYSKVDETVLIQGETGVGKEMFAQGIHRASRRRDMPFVAVNCASLPESILESELFGYVKGAFTGASRDGKRGLFECAHTGTIFLDEIGEISPSMQGKLLRVLQEHSIRRIGAETPIPIDIRIIAATNRDLVSMVREGTFRADLYFRINVLGLCIPPLRQRQGDIILLADAFLSETSERAGRYLRFSSQAKAAMLRYDWPGNIRELQNMVRRVSVISDSDEIGPELVETYIQENRGLSAAGGSLRSRYTLEEALALSGGNKLRAAELLGISRATLYRMLERKGM